MKKTYNKPTTLSLLMQTDSMLLAASTTTDPASTTAVSGRGLHNNVGLAGANGGTLAGGSISDAW